MPEDRSVVKVGSTPGTAAGASAGAAAGDAMVSLPVARTLVSLPAGGGGMSVALRASQPAGTFEGGGGGEAAPGGSMGGGKSIIGGGGGLGGVRLAPQVGAS